MSDQPQLSREQLAQLIPLCPLMMDWLRNISNETADLFMQSKAEDYSKVATGLDALIKTMDSGNSSNLPFSALTKIFQKYDGSTWANALRLVLTQSSPRLIPAEVGSDLVGTIPRLNGAITVNEVCHIVGPLLDKLPRAHFETLGEFCSLIRDTATNVTLLACLVGPQLLMPNLSIATDVNQGPGALASSAVMELLIIESESLFGRSASQRVYYPFGAYNQLEQKSAQVDFISAMNDEANVIVKQSLRAFYDWRDPVRAYYVDSLFNSYPIHQIAPAIQQRYGLLPPGWGYILQAIVDKEAAMHRVDDINLLNKETKVVRGGTTMKPSKNKEGLENDNRAFATNVTAELMQKLNENNLKRLPSQPLEENDNLINEICQHEKNYFDVVNTFLEAYVTQLEEISEGKRGETERKALGLTPQEIDSMCGSKLKAVRDASNKLLAKLDVVTMFDVKPQGGKGRIGLLAAGFIDVLNDLHCLSPYLCNYEKNIKLLMKKITDIEGKGKKNKKKKNGQMTFLDIWEVERAKHEALKLSRMDNVLIKPVQRLPMYKIQWGKMVKTTNESHPAYADVLKVQEGIDSLAKRIDQEMKSRKKAEKLLGEELS